MSEDRPSIGLVNFDLQLRPLPRIFYALLEILNMSGAPQQVNVADLDLAQLAEVRKQLDEVCSYPASKSLLTFIHTGNYTPHLIVPTAQSSAGKI